MKTTTLSLLRFISLLILLCCTIAMHAATKYVSNTGNNNNSGNSWAQAWLTLHWASTHIAAGDTVWVQNGTYAGFDCRVNANAANPIVFIAAGNNVVINSPNPVTTDGINIENANYIEINGFRVINQPRNGIRLVNADFCIVRNTYCDNNFERGIFTGFTDDILIEYNECLNSIDEHGIYVSNTSDRSIIRYNECHHNNRGGIQINADASQGGDGISTDPEIYGNILYENGVAGGAAINLDGVQSAFIYNNLLYENHASGIALFQIDGGGPSINATIVYNTIINASDARWCILIVDGATGAQVYNNIIINQHTSRGSIALDPDAVTGFDSDYNILVNRLSVQGDGSYISLAAWQALGYDEHSNLAQPLASIFVAPASGDYHLLNNSQAVNAGSLAFSYGIDEDIEGIARPQSLIPDLGAYEATGPLSLDEELEEEDKDFHGILVTSSSISWSKHMDGTMHILSMDGKLIDQFSIEFSGEYMLERLVPGVYIAAVHDRFGVKWVKRFLVTE